MVPNTCEDRIYGCLLGSLVGDATASKLKITKKRQTEAEMLDLMQMTGGGIYNVGPGELSERGQLVMCLLSGLGTGHGKIEPIVENFGKWIKTCKLEYVRDEVFESALSPLRENNDAGEVKKAALANNTDSTSNGSLMIITPLALWASEINDPELLRQAVAEVVELIHPSLIVQEAVYLYCLAIKHLVQNPYDSARGIRAFTLA